MVSFSLHFIFMKNLQRREFLQTTSMLLAGAVLGSGFVVKKQPLLSFSTLGCPDWSLRQIVDFAKEQGYQGIEVRGILKQLDLTQRVEFSKENITTTLQLLSDNELSFVNLGSSATLHFSDASERKKNLDEGSRGTGRGLFCRGCAWASRRSGRGRRGGRLGCRGWRLRG